MPAGSRPSTGPAGLAGRAVGARVLHRSLPRERLETLHGERRGGRRRSGWILCPGNVQTQGEHRGSPCPRRQRRARAAAGPNPEAVRATVKSVSSSKQTSCPVCIPGFYLCVSLSQLLSASWLDGIWYCCLLTPGTTAPTLLLPSDIYMDTNVILISIMAAKFVTQH